MSLALGLSLGLLLVLVFLLLASWAIRRGLAAPRLIERSTPADLGLMFRSVAFPTNNGRTLRGWFIPAQRQTAPAVVLLHGWGGNAETMLPLADPLHRAGYAQLLFDARCHGMSDDDSFASLPRFAEDLEHALAWLRQQVGIDAARVAAIGHSVGAGACLLAAARGAPLAAVVSIAAFAHPEAMMRRWLAWKHIPYWPLGWAILGYVQHAIGHRFDAIAPVNTIRTVRCPVLLAHGTADETVPVEEVRQIFANRAHDAVELLLIAGSHDEYAEMDAGIDAVLEFLSRHLLAKGASP
ncbi:alpha/beta hydrolase [Sulfuricystis thermophila]|uniref:alpha/beta hydrolase n=1 Tax=Sulfuricystis thermophila TaxID=2496847 RepID=UPI0024DF9BF3|nr:alpha/beta fold hydrolase [Sulfuricystis thermophila]